MSTERIIESTESETKKTTTQKVRRGFAAMDPSRVAEIARKGGKAAHAAGTAHQFSSDEAKRAGKKGGLTPRRKKPVVDNQPDA